MKLYQGYPWHIEHKGKCYRIKPFYDRVLKLFDLFKDETITNEDKIHTAIRLLGMPKNTPTEALNAAFEVLFHSDSKEQKEPIFDFTQDSGYIYSSFLQAYNIDLIKERGKLHWLAFIDLFNGLPEDTQMARIISIRAKPLPQPNGHNQQQILAEAELKRKFALKKTPDQIRKDKQAGLERMFNTLLQLAKE